MFCYRSTKIMHGNGHENLAPPPTRLPRNLLDGYVPMGWASVMVFRSDCARFSGRGSASRTSARIPAWSPSLTNSSTPGSSPRYVFFCDYIILSWHNGSDIFSS